MRQCLPAFNKKSVFKMNAYFKGILKEKRELRCMQNVLLFLLVPCTDISAIKLSLSALPNIDQKSRKRCCWQEEVKQINLINLNVCQKAKKSCSSFSLILLFYFCFSEDKFNPLFLLSWHTQTHK